MTMGFAQASIPAPGGTIHACYRTNTGLLQPPIGTVRIIDNSNSSCGAGETSITWSQTGPQGPVGATGATGATGAQGSQGIPGSVGPSGLTGATGPTGPTGAPGTPGPQGAVGAQGPAGSPGQTGPQGVAGPSISGRELVYVNIFIPTPGDYLQDVYCPPGKLAVGAGASRVNYPEIAEIQSVLIESPDTSFWRFEFYSTANYQTNAVVVVICINS